MLSTGVETAFDRVFGGDCATHADLLAFAVRPEGAPGGAPARPRAGERCPLCRCATHDFEPEPLGLPSAVREQIRQAVPGWDPADGLCRQCADLYRARIWLEARAAEPAGSSEAPDRRFRTERKVMWYRRAVARSDYAATVLGAVGGVLADCASALDVGAGCGALTLPLAGRVRHVTALEPAPAMAKALHKEAATRGLANVEVVEAAWGEVPVRASRISSSAPTWVGFPPPRGSVLPGGVQRGAAVGRARSRRRSPNPGR